MVARSLKGEIKYRITLSKGLVFTLKDFLGLSGRDQVGPALRQLVLAGELIKFGRGKYTKAKRSKLTGKIIPVKPLPELAKEALTEKLKVTVVPTVEAEAYNVGESTQVPSCSRQTGLQPANAVGIVIEALKSDSLYKNKYEMFVESMSYAADVEQISFSKAIEKLTQIHSSLISKS